MSETETSKPDLEIPWLDSKNQKAKTGGLIMPDYNPVESLLLKLERFLVEQPEWALILQAPRPTRRKAVSLLSKRILTVPRQGKVFGGVDL